MKTPSDELFKLIKSLSPQEKAFFKLFASRKAEDNNYVLLFNAIDKMDVYDEAWLKSKLKNRPIIRNFKHSKSYTSEAILRCLQEFHSSESIDAQLSTHIQQIRVLINKQLFSQAKKMILRAEKYALAHFAFQYLVILGTFKREVMVLEANTDEMKRFPETGYVEEVRRLDLLKNLSDYHMLDVRATFATYSQLTVSDKTNEGLRSLLRHPLLRNESKAMSYPARLKYHGALSTLHFVLNNWKESAFHASRSVQLMEGDPRFLKTHPEQYLVGLGNFFASLIMLRKDKEIVMLYKKIKTFVDGLPGKQRSQRIYRRYSGINNNYLSFHLETFQVDKALQLSLELLPKIKRFYSPMPYVIFRYNLFLAYFLKGDFHNALKQVHEILTRKEPGILEDIIVETEIVNIVTHYELGNVHLLPGLCKTAFRYIQKMDRLTPKEKLLLDFFSAAGKLKSKQEKRNAFAELRNRLEAAAAKEIPGGFDFISWIESKMENRPLVEIMKGKQKV